MNGLIIRMREVGCASLKELFNAMDNSQNEYNWLITSYECYPQNIQNIEKLSGDWCWITGNELTHMVELEDFQWVWGVLTAFPKEIVMEEVLKYKFPQADGYRGFWENPISMQHPLGKIEIVAWDGTIMLVISEEKNIVDCISSRISEVENLETYNEQM